MNAHISQSGGRSGPVRRPQLPPSKVGGAMNKQVAIRCRHPGRAAVDRAIAELADFKLLASDDMEAGYHDDYISHHRHEYVRTVRDVLKHRPPVEPGIAVLEIGAFFGVVCIALASLGYEVTAADIPEYIELPEQAERYGRFGIQTRGVRLRTSSCRSWTNSST